MMPLLLVWSTLAAVSGAFVVAAAAAWAIGRPDVEGEEQ